MEIDIDHELDTVSRRVEQTEQRVAHIGPVTGEASSADGAISVEVRPGGLLSQVRLRPAALAAGSEALAAQIMAVAQRATRRAGANMHTALSPVLGPSGEKHLASLGYEPDDEEEDADFHDPLGPAHLRRGTR